MLSTRSVIVAAVIVAILSLLGLVFEASRPPGQDGVGADSFGYRVHGQRAFYELLQTLGIPVDRAVAPPTAFLSRNPCLVFIEPDPDLVSLEPGYLRQIADWLTAGGAVLLAPARTVTGPSADDSEDEFAVQTTLLDELGIGPIRLAPLEVLREEAKGKPTPAQRVPSALAFRTPDTTKIDIRATGSLSDLGKEVHRLEIPSGEVQVIDSASTATPMGVVWFSDDTETSYIIAAEYVRGQGRAVVVSDGALFTNRFIHREDNPVLLAHLAAGFGRPVVFDEFYHGLTIRGNPAWLFSRKPYGFMALAIAIAVALWAWRQAIRFGPPLPARAPQRRSLAEYVEAMGGLFRRGKCLDFLLQEARFGVIWSVRKRLGIAESRITEKVLLTALARRDPERATRLRQALKEADLLQSNAVSLTRANVIRVVRKMSECL
jgi:hypothetical protein